MCNSLFYCTVSKQFCPFYCDALIWYNAKPSSGSVDKRMVICVCSLSLWGDSHRMKAKYVGFGNGSKRWEGRLKRRRVLKERERLHPVPTHIVSLWSQPCSDWWCNYNMDMRYLHKAATVIHRQSLFIKLTPKEHLNSCCCNMNSTRRYFQFAYRHNAECVKWCLIYTV